jgi:hypothetical protein
MNPILLAVVAVTVIGIVCAIILAVASKIMKVNVDERFPIIPVSYRAPTAAPADMPDATDTPRRCWKTVPKRISARPELTPCHGS